MYNIIITKYKESQHCMMPIYITSLNDHKLIIKINSKITKNLTLRW